MRHPWVNTALLVLLIAQGITGFLGLIGGQPGDAWRLWLHDVGGWAIALLLIWKGAVILDSLRRRTRPPDARPLFLALTALLILTLTTGIAWTTAGRTVIAGYSLLTVHTILAVVVLVILVSHVLSMRFILSVPAAHDRRSLFRLVAGVAGGAALFLVSDAAKTVLDLPGARRRFTGSYETGSFTGRFPPTSWLNDDPDRVYEQSWRLKVDGRVGRPGDLTYRDLEQLPRQKLTALIDCTGGWYSTQEWEGVRVSDILARVAADDGAGSVTFTSVTGYDRRHSFSQARNLILATHVAGQRLSHGHGFPLRLVVPGERGYAWVKWVTGITVNEHGEAWQPPLPLE